MADTEHAADVPPVEYTVNPDGTETITLNAEWNDQFRFDNYAYPVREAVREEYQRNPTLTELRRMRLAFSLGEPLHSAVWDDIMTNRAEAMVKAQRLLEGWDEKISDLEHDR